MYPVFVHGAGTIAVDLEDDVSGAGGSDLLLLELLELLELELLELEVLELVDITGG